MRKSFVFRLAFVAVVIVALAVGTAAYAGKKPGGGGGGGGGCPKGMACPDIWDPVTCADGITYSNQCYADNACAPKPCQPAGGGPVEI